MRNIFLSLALIISAHTAAAQSLTQKMEAVVQNHALPGLLAARIENGKVAQTIAVGCARFASDGMTCAEKLTPHHAARIASISKLVVAIGVSELVRTGKLDLDADISNYLGFSLRNPAFPNQSITTRMLLSHTSSVRDGETYSAVYPAPLTDLLKTADRFDSRHGPGSYFTYCNMNYGIIGQIVEKITGERFDAYMQHVVFRPMNINAGYNWSGAKNLAKLKVATLYRKKKEFDETWTPTGPWIPQIDDFAGGAPQPNVRGRSDVPTDYSIGSNGTLFSPQGGLRISITDLAKIAARLARNTEPALRALSRPVWALAANNGANNGDNEDGFYTGFGSGIQLYRTATAGPVYPGHFAEAYGLRGGLLFDPQRKSAWIYLITGFSDDPTKGTAKSSCTFPGLGPAETDALCALLAQ
jgi:CubicO group peptidase (beta-lactamase class C family)